MSIATKRTNIIDVFKSIFSSDLEIEKYEDIKLPEELNNALKSIETKEQRVEQAINMQSNSSKKGGFGKKIDPNTEKAMRAMHKEVKQNSMVDRERE